MNSYTKYSDAELFALFQKGDGGAFAEIYERYWAPLLRHARLMTNNSEQSEDIVQDIFQMLLEKSFKIELYHSLNAFLYTSIKYRVLKQLRHDKVVDKYLSTVLYLSEAGVESTDLAMEEKELIRRIEYAMDKLPPKMREVFELSRIDNLSYSQISERLNVTDHTVRKQISKALKSLRKTLNRAISLFV